MRMDEIMLSHFFPLESLINSWKQWLVCTGPYRKNCRFWLLIYIYMYMSTYPRCVEILRPCTPDETPHEHMREYFSFFRRERVLSISESRDNNNQQRNGSNIDENRTAQQTHLHLCRGHARTSGKESPTKDAVHAPPPLGYVAQHCPQQVSSLKQRKK